MTFLLSEMLLVSALGLNFAAFEPLEFAAFAEPEIVTPAPTPRPDPPPPAPQVKAVEIDGFSGCENGQCQPRTVRRFRFRR